MSNNNDSQHIRQVYYRWSGIKRIIKAATQIHEKSTDKDTTEMYSKLTSSDGRSTAGMSLVAVIDIDIVLYL